MHLTLSRPHTTLLITTAILLLLGASGWSLSRSAHAASPSHTGTPAPVPVSTAIVQTQSMPVYLTGVGTVTPNASVTIKTRIDGQLDKVNFTEGQEVKAGQWLAQIDARALQAQLAQAQAQKAKDAAQLTNAQRDLQRYTTLVEQDAATQQTLNAQQAQVAQLQAAVQADDAQIELAKVQLSYTKILAPISGRVGARLVDPGNIVHATDTNGLVVINQVNPITVVFTLPEENFQNINTALRTAGTQPLGVQAYPRNSDQMLAQGKLTLLNNQIDTSTGTIQLKATFPNPEHTLWPGQYVNARLILGERKQALTVPAAAIQRGPNSTYVYTVQADDTVQTQPVHVLNIQEGTAIIDKGLSAGQRVVVDGQYKLKPGAKITDSSTKSATPSTTQGVSN